MLCYNTFYLELTKIPFSPRVHRVRIFNALFMKPLMNFKIRNNPCPGTICNADTIGDMILVSMTYENEIGLQLINLHDLIGKLIWGNEGIKQERLPPNSYRKCGMTVIC